MNREVRIGLIIVAFMVPIVMAVVILGIYFRVRLGWSFHINERKPAVRTEMITDKVDLKDFESMKIDASSADIELLRGDAYQIEYRTLKGEEPKITEEGGVLTIKQPSQKSGWFWLGHTEESVRYTITIPENKDTKLDIRTSSGDIKINGITSSGHVKASSGDIEINDFKGDETVIETSSGEIMCDNSRISKTSFTASSGNIKISNSKNDEMSVDASSGDIELNEIKAEKLKCETSSGDIEIQDSKIETVDCEASSGKISMELDGDEDDYSYDIDSSSGSIRLNGHKYEEKYKKDVGGNKKISVTTTSGDIKISVD